MRKIYRWAMAPKNPARYGAKNSRPVATTVDEQTYQAITRLADQGGISVAAWLRQICVEEARKKTVIGLGRLEERDDRFAPWQLNETTQPAPDDGTPIINPSTMRDGGSSDQRKSGSQ